MHIITGIGRSGTSFISTILKNLGHEMGIWIESVNAGYESPSVVEPNSKILSGAYWGSAKEIASLVKVAKETHVAKDPRFTFTIGHWIMAGAKIDSVVQCVRDYREVVDSSERTNAGMMAIFNGINDAGRKKIYKALNKGFVRTVKEYGIPIGTIRYPRSTQDYKEVRCLFELGIATNEDALKVAWHKAKWAKPSTNS